MSKKYLPYIILVFAGLLLFYVKSHQRGGNTRERIEVKTDAVTTTDAVVESNEGFSRHPQTIIYTKHAKCRMECRHISEAEIKEILETGKVNARKIEEDDRGKTYPLEGKTSTDKLLRIVVAPKKTDLVIVTVIDLDKDWPCDCH